MGTFVENTEQFIDGKLGARSVLTKNKQLGISTYNLLRGLTCPGASTWCKGEWVEGEDGIWVWKKGKCYAEKGLFILDDAVLACMKRTHWTQLECWETRMVEALRGVQLPIRWHSAGDVYSAWYARRMYSVFKWLSWVNFFLYSRSWVDPVLYEELRRLDSLPNVLVWASCDPSMPHPDWPRVAYIYGTPGASKPNCLKQLPGKRYNCKTCGRCVPGSRARKVTFLEH